MKTGIVIEGQSYKISNIWGEDSSFPNDNYVKEVIEVIEEEKDEIALLRGNGNSFDNISKLFMDGKGTTKKCKCNFVGFYQFSKKDNSGVTGKEEDYLIISLPKYLKRSFGDVLPKVSDFPYDLSEDKNEQLLNKYIEFLLELFRFYAGKIRKDDIEIRNKDALFFRSIENGNNRFLQADKIIEQYKEFGIYTVSRTVNSNRGRVAWGETVKKTRPLISDGQPIYTRLIKKRNVQQENLISEIQKAALVYARELFALDKSEDFSAPDISFKQILGNTDYYRRMLRRERDVVNKDSDIQIINGLEKYIIGESITNREGDIYAVSNFEVIFEKIVSDIFGNELYQRYEGQPYEGGRSLFYEINANQTIQWKLWDGAGNWGKLKPDNYTKNINQDKPLSHEGYFDIDVIVPDVVFQDKSAKEKRRYYILDAKYHDIHDIIEEEKNYLKNLPKQNDDIYKQYYYAEVVRNLTGEEPVNVFVVPNPDGDEDAELITVKGHNKKNYSSGDDRKIYLVYLNTTKAIESVLKQQYNIAENRKELQEKIEAYEEEYKKLNFPTSETDANA